MGSLWQDLRYAVRMLGKNRGFSIAVVAVLALGIGANTAIFSVVNTVLLRPMPFPQPDRLVKILHVPPVRSFPGTRRFAVSPANYLDWRARSHSFDGMAAYQNRQFALTGFDRPESVTAVTAGADFFSVLGTEAELGRVFGPDDDQPGRGKVVVISHAFWQSHYGSQADVLGRTMLLTGEAYAIIGVAPARLRFKPWTPTSVDVWVPLDWNAELRAERKNHNYLVVARLRPGVAVAQAQTEMDAVSKQLEREYPEADRDWGAVVYPLRDDVVGTIRPALLVVLGAVAFVLLIACANVASLCTARNLGRRKEIALRAALGASRRRTLQQLFCESLVLALAGGMAGLALGAAALPVLIAAVSEQFPLERIPLDARVLLFTLAISILTGILAGALPAWRSSNADLNEALKQGVSRTTTDRAAGVTRNALVAAEVALSLMLLAGAGLMMRSLWLLTGLNPGFEPRNLLTLTAPFPGKKGAEPARVAGFYDRALEDVRSLPGVQSAGLVDNLPLEGGSIQPFVIEGRPAALFAQQPTVAVRAISTGYLSAMRIPLLRGRDLEASDVIGRPDVALISESMARRFWPGEDPIGRRVTLSFTPDKLREIVGVVGDVKMNALDAAEPLPSLYEPESQEAQFPMMLVVRTAVRPESLIGAVTATLQKLAPDRPVRNVRTMQSIVDESISNRRISMMLLAVFAGLAVLLAAFGLYSVLAYTVRRRVREIGIRIALGASVGDVLRIVAWESMRPTLVGIAAGLVGGLLLSSLVRGLIYGIRPTDPAAFVAAALLLAVVAMAASIVPAWRATRVDPLNVLREE